MIGFDLPPGKTCGDCNFYLSCKWFPGGSTFEDSTKCKMYPIRGFEQSQTPQRSSVLDFLYGRFERDKK